MKRVREITSEEENFRVEPLTDRIHVVRRDPVEPVPVGSYVAMVFRVTGYNKDCDGSLMARVECVDAAGRTTGWTADALGLYPDSTWQLESPDELDKKSDVPGAH